MHNPPIIQLFNQFINVFWSLFAFAPIIWFWKMVGINHWFIFFLAIAIACSLIPRKLLEKVRISDDLVVYERFGVKFIRKFVQNGDWIKSLPSSASKPQIRNTLQAYNYLKTVAMYERFHWMCFAFFLNSAFYAFLCGYVLLGIWITVANIIYNVTSILLQQYNRLRLNGLIKKPVMSSQR